MEGYQKAELHVRGDGVAIMQAESDRLLAQLLLGS